VRASVSRRTVNADEESTLSNGRPGGVESHQDVTSAVDEQRLLAETSTLSQVHVSRLVVCSVDHCIQTSLITAVQLASMHNINL